MKIRDLETENRSDNFKKISRSDISSPEELKTEPLKALFKWWAGFAPEIPSRRNFDVSDHWKIAPHIHLLQVIKPGHYLYRLNGEKVVDIVGGSRRGDTITLENPLPEDRLFAQYLDDIVARRVPRRCFGTLGLFDKEHSMFESVDCPVKNETGDIEFIIGALSTVDSRNTEFS